MGAEIIWLESERQISVKHEILYSVKGINSEKVGKKESRKERKLERKKAGKKESWKERKKEIN